MKKIAVTCVVAGLVASGPVWSDDDHRRRGGDDDVQAFATLPASVRFPEGITANPRTGEIFVATFDFGPNSNKLLRFSRHGKLIASRDFGGTPLLGLAFNREDRKVYIANPTMLTGAPDSKIQRINADFDETTPIVDVAFIPKIGAPAPRVAGNPDGSQDVITFGSGAAVPNAMVFDSKGGLYVSDSFQGAVFWIDNAAGCATPCPVTTVVHDPLLATAGFPPFGANGLALSYDGNTLFVANTGDDRVLKVDLATKAVTVFAESINGADGIAFDDDGRLWVAENQNDSVAALNDKGRVVDRLGEFGGIRRDGSPRGLLFPASIVIVDDWMYVTNLALPLTGAAGDEPEEDVTLYTVSRIRIPSH
ncbi:MAG TPA: SMP-30/gluconolactonase/LRE family protein [Burkholderiales bacterium]|nr:SMP-30/gluconolactonase/LRE family protein [Burkholderiales bacterium]